MEKSYWVLIRVLFNRQNGVYHECTVSITAPLLSPEALPDKLREAALADYEKDRSPPGEAILASQSVVMLNFIALN